MKRFAFRTVAHVASLVVGVMVATLPSSADAGLEPPTRAEEWRKLREERARRLEPHRPKGLESGLLWAKDSRLLARLAIPGVGFKGFRPVVGGLGSGSGYGLGVLWDRVNIGGELDLTASAAATFKGYQQYVAGLSLPHLADGRLAVVARGRYLNRAQQDFYGLGPDSLEADESTYRHEDTALDLEAIWYLDRRLRLSAGVGFNWMNVGPGTADRVVQERFDDTTAPGLDRQTDFRRYAIGLVFDSRDKPLNPRSGTLVRGEYTYWDDAKLDVHDFGRFDVEAQQYFRFNHGHRVIALRALTSFDEARAGHKVPFYLQQTLGGNQGLRGYPDFRFADQRRLLLNAEYRWEAWIGLDAALFVDAGKVFRGASDLTFDDLETGYGAGLRFDASRSVYLRLDVARGHDSTRLHVQFEHVF